MTKLLVRGLAALGIIGATLSACGAQKLKDDHAEVVSDGPEMFGFQTKCPNVSGRTFTISTFYASFLPPNRTILQSLTFKSDGTVTYTKSVVDGDRVDTGQQSVKYLQVGCDLSIGNYTDPNAKDLQFHLEDFAVSITNNATGEIFTQPACVMKEP